MRASSPAGGGDIGVRVTVGESATVPGGGAVAGSPVPWDTVALLIPAPYAPSG